MRGGSGGGAHPHIPCLSGGFFVTRADDVNASCGRTMTRVGGVSTSGVT